jgi:hypothetical protein
MASPRHGLPITPDKVLPILPDHALAFNLPAHGFRLVSLEQLKTFVLSEVLKLASWTGDRFEFFHYRDKEQDEVDIVIEDHERRIVGLVVKAAATVGSADFGGLRKPADAAGARFALGVVLCDERQVVPLGPQLFAAPISSLWG